jgi:hypothetical protein
VLVEVSDKKDRDLQVKLTLGAELELAPSSKEAATASTSGRSSCFISGSDISISFVIESRWIKYLIDALLSGLYNCFVLEALVVE